MSYDLSLFRLPPGVDPETVLAELEELESSDNSERPSADAEAKKEDLAARLVASRRSLQRFHFDYAAIAHELSVSEEQARSQWRHVELNSPDGGPGIQIHIMDSSASLALPYWHADLAAATAWDEVWDYLKTLQDHTGYAVYDPQLGRVLNLATDLRAVLAKYAEGVAFTNQVAHQAGPPPRPWWKFW